MHTRKMHTRTFLRVTTRLSNISHVTYRLLSLYRVLRPCSQLILARNPLPAIELGAEVYGANQAGKKSIARASVIGIPSDISSYRAGYGRLGPHPAAPAANWRGCRHRIRPRASPRAPVCCGSRSPQAALTLGPTEKGTGSAVTMGLEVRAGPKRVGSLRSPDRVG